VVIVMRQVPYCMFDAPEFRDKAEGEDLVLNIRNNTIIRSGMKSILDFRHNIEKYGFVCIEFGNPHPWAHAVLVADDGIPHTRSHRCSALAESFLYKGGRLFN
jgi:hypothetical protein